MSSDAFRNMALGALLVSAGVPRGVSPPGCVGSLSAGSEESMKSAFVIRETGATIHKSFSQSFHERGPPRGHIASCV